MLGLTDRQWFLVAVILYGISALHTIFLWRGGFRHHNRVTYVLLLLGLVAHTVAMLKRGFSLERCPIHNLYEATTFVMWTIVAAYLVMGLWGRMRFLGAFASPVLFAVGLFALMPSLDQHHGPQPDFSLAWTSVHAALVLLSYGAFGLGAVAGSMYLTQERNLKFKKIQAVFSLLPPIQRLEAAMSSLLIAGFILLTLGLASASQIQIANRLALTSDPKVIWSGVVWVLYLALLVLRWRYAYRGRRMACGLIGAFAFVLLTFWGTALLSPLHNPSA